MKIRIKPVKRSREVRRLELQLSLSHVRTNIMLANNRMSPMEKLMTAQLANEIAARLRRL